MVKMVFSDRTPGVEKIWPEVFEALNVSLVDSNLRHYVDIGESAPGLADRDGGPPPQRL